ncbi:MAG: cbb3-type cytochrome c oxidase subunit II [Planctomycetota bacterium]
MFESKSGILLLAGLGFFILAFVSNAIVPILMYKDLEEQTVEQLVDPKVNKNVVAELRDLERRYPETFQKYIGEASPARAAELLEKGRDVYVGEGCWHCHSQFIRPVSNESKRWGPVAASEEYENELQRPVLFGTRRVGPDLSREGGRRGSDWHVAHFWDPALTSPGTVMPAYKWFLEENSQGQPVPNEKGFAIVLYLQWLGSWLPYPTYPYYEQTEEVLGKAGY